MLASVGLRAGARTKVETYTEVVLQRQISDRSFRPDGLILVRSGSSTWTALVEAKVGNSNLTPEQISSYVDFAKVNGINAVITLSNQFSPLPSHHPVQLSAPMRRKADLFHWSWMFVLTEAALLLGNDEIVDQDQRVILREMVRFLTHPSAGVKSFEQMPPAWSSLCASVLAGGAISQNSAETQEVIGAWHQEVRDLSLTLSRQLAPT